MIDKVVLNMGGGEEKEGLRMLKIILKIGWSALPNVPKTYTNLKKTKVTVEKLKKKVCL